MENDEELYADFTLVPSKISVEEVNNHLSITIEVDSDQLESHPDLLVNIDSKWHDKGVLENPLLLVPGIQHRIVLAWEENNVESFRI